MKKNEPRSTLREGARVLVVGGGPAGSFFAVRLLRAARRSGGRIEVFILEKKRKCPSAPPGRADSRREGCNFCAGGISPMLFDALGKEDMIPPGGILQKEIHSVTIHSDWKNIELPVPSGRTLASVFRGTRPASRRNKCVNFDAFLLERAEREGARILTGQAVRAGRTSSGALSFSYLVPGNGPPREETIEVDFAAIACGINSSPTHGRPGPRLRPPPFLESLIPGFRPPPARRTLICELETEKGVLAPLEGTFHFIQYGSPDLKIEMASIIPKSGYLTLALLGETVDEGEEEGNEEIVRKFLELPEIRRLIPGHVHLRPACACNPVMNIGPARRPFAERVAVIGDLAVSRLYKDGLYSAYLTGSALADCILGTGIDAKSLKQGYGRAFRFLERDLFYGKLVFFVNRTFFRHPLLSRVIYQAILTERKGKPEKDRTLARILWKTASGDGTYKSILLAMFHPKNLWRIFTGGVLVTARNFAAELVLGLKWKGFGRHPTGVAREAFEERRKMFEGLLDAAGGARRPDFESMYSIKIRGCRKRVLDRLGRFGEPDRLFLRPRFVKIRRVDGSPNQPGCTVQYDLPFKWLSFQVVLEKVENGGRFFYRVQGGFGSGGILAFDIRETGPDLVLLSVYVGFDFPRPSNPFKRALWKLFRVLFPGFVHDVIWNHSLCRLKSLVEIGPL